jgi:hypothetical protein
MMTKQQSPYQCNQPGPWIIGRVVRGIIIALAFGLIFSIFVRLLWNGLMPGLFGLREVSFGQAFGMLILARLLFGGRGMQGMRPGFAGRWRGHRPWGWGPCSKEDAANGEIEDWRYYDSWWQAEGREAFKKYIDSHGHGKESELRKEG